MEHGQPSPTAIIAALLRAAHLLLDADPKILRDELALGLSGVENEAALRTRLEAMETAIARRSTPEVAQAMVRSARAATVMRQRYAQDELGEAIARGGRQYVILGAGLDAFAYQPSALASVVRIFEVDHPTTQQWKRARLQELHITLPSNLQFIPLDFEQQTLAAGLRGGGHRPELPTFVSWLGVTQYLTEAAVFETLGYVASLAPGSEIVFQYVVPESRLDDESRRVLAMFQETAAAGGEPWLSLFESSALAARVQELGFRQVWDFGPEEANARYFAGRTDGLRASPLHHLMTGQVGSGS
jgi:methyltransferase (TIGR00027 family)